MAKCEMCGKERVFGNNVSHAKNRTSRDYKPNLQKVTTVVDGQTKTLVVCTRCLRTLHKTR